LANGQVHAPAVLTPGETQPIYFHSASFVFTLQRAVKRESTLKQNLHNKCFKNYRCYNQHAADYVIMFRKSWKGWNSLDLYNQDFFQPGNICWL